MAEDRSVVLLIRVWFEGQDAAFRARLITTGLPDAGAVPQETTIAVAASPADVIAAVEEWLRDIVR